MVPAEKRSTRARLKGKERAKTAEKAANPKMATKARIFVGLRMVGRQATVTLLTPDGMYSIPSEQAREIAIGLAVTADDADREARRARKVAQ